MAVLRYFHQDPRQTSVQESSVIDKLGTVLTQKLTTINQSITNNTQVLEDKLNSVPGKSLSTNDFTDEYKNKLRGIEEGAEVNVQSDWGEDDNTADSYIKNKPVIDDIVTQNSENLITSGAVFTAIDELPEPMIFKGSLGTGGTIQTLPAPSADNVGFVYKVITAGTYYGITTKPGDAFISDGSDWILIPSGDEPEGTVMSVGLTVPTGLLVSGSPITTSGTLAITYALGYAIPTTAKLDEWDAKQNAISDLSTIRTNASNGNTAYGWGNHANAGYLAAISDLATIRSNASEGHTAYGWGNHANAGYLTGITKAMVTTALGYTPPQQDTNTTYSAGTGLSLSGTTFSLALTKALVTTALGYTPPTQDTNTWRGITDSYSGTDSSISLSQKGGNALYNALLNGYANSAGNADTVDSRHATGFVYWEGNPGKNNMNDIARSFYSASGMTNLSSSSVDNGDMSGWTHFLSTSYADGGNGTNSWVFLLACPAGSSNLLFRSRNGGTVTNGTAWATGWTKILHAGNSSVSKSGETLTVKINGTSQSLTNTWRGITNDYNPTTSSDSTSLSLTGAKNLYNQIPAVTLYTVVKLIARGSNFDPVQAGYFAGMTTSSGITSDWWHILSMDWSGNDSANWISQLALPTQARNGVYYRSWNAGQDKKWVKLWDLNNLTNLNQLTNGPGYITSSGSCSYASSIPSRTIWGQSFNGTGNVDGCIFINPGSYSSWCEGIRIASASNGWTTLLLGATGTSGTNANAWSFHTNSGNFYLNRNGSNGHTGYEVCNINGKWGVGTTSPSTKFHVTGRVTCEYSSTDSGSFSAIRGVYEGRLGINSNGYTVLTTNKVGDSTARVRISLSPHTLTNRILVYDSVELSSGSGIYLASSYSSSGNPFYIQNNELYDNDVSIGRPGDSGRPWVGIGISKPSYKLHVNGACGATSFPNTSDIRLKDILSDWLPKLEDIANAPSFLFKWNNIKDDTVHLGSSAQYWEEKAPNVVTEANDEIKTKSLQYDVLGTVNSIAIAKEVVSLKEEIKLLQALIAELKLLLNN